jgi:hypothetical protein
MAFYRSVLASLVAFGLANCGGGSRDFKDTDAAGKGGAAGATGGGTAGSKGGSGGSAGSIAGSAGSGAGALGGEGGMSGEASEAGASGDAAHGAGAGGDSGAPGMSGEGGAGGEGGAAGSMEPVPFSCGDELPPVTFPEVFTGTGTPPVPEGGAITEGLYLLKQVVIYGTYSSVPGDVFELRAGQLHHRHTTFSSSGSALTGYEQVGTYATTGAAMAIDVDACGVGSGPALWRFTAAGNEIRLFATQSSTTWIQTFELEQ